MMKRSMTVKEIILTLWMMTFIMINKICLFSFEIGEGLKRHWKRGKFYILKAMNKAGDIKNRKFQKSVWGHFWCKKHGDQTGGFF